MKLRPEQEKMFDTLVMSENVDTFKEAAASDHPVHQIPSENTSEVLELLSEPEYRELVDIVAAEIGVSCG